MLYVYDVLFIPEGVRLRDITQTKRVRLTSDTKYSSPDTIRNNAQLEALRSNEIDQYAIRNDYWKPVCCEMSITDDEWDSGIESYLESEYNMNAIRSIRSGWDVDLIKCVFPSKEAKNSAVDSITDSYPNISDLIKEKRKEIYIQNTIRGSISSLSERKTKEIFREYMLGNAK